MLTDQQVDTVTSYGDGAFRVMAETGLDKQALDAKLLNFNVEQCPHCHWYTDSFHLLADGDDEPDGFCDNCRAYDKPSNAKFSGDEKRSFSDSAGTPG